jgi:hypothetical protein
MSEQADALAAALLECRAALASAERPLRGRELELIDEIFERLAELPGDQTTAEWLVALCGPDPERREALADVVSVIARNLAQGDNPPSSAPEAELWQTLVIVVDLLYGSGVAPVGRLPFISDRLLELLLAESRDASRRVDRAGEAGRVLASLAVSGKLRDAVADAVGFPVVPTYRAVYLYDTPGSHVHTHVDTHEYEIVFHLILEHASQGDGEGSALVVHRLGEDAAHRIRLAPGEGVALRGRGTIHSWEPMAADEHRTLLAIGFQPAT